VTECYRFPIPAATCLSRGLAEGGFEGGVDTVGEVGEYAFGGHAKSGGDQFGVEIVDQVDQSGGAQPLGSNPGVVEQVAEEVRRRGRLAGAGDLSDQDVRVGGSEGAVALRRRAWSPPTKVERQAPQVPWRIVQTGHPKTCCVASERAGGPGRVSRSLNATVPSGVFRSAW
jgi:hypothetical protein